MRTHESGNVSALQLVLDLYSAMMTSHRSIDSVFDALDSANVRVESPSLLFNEYAGRETTSSPRRTSLRMAGQQPDSVEQLQTAKLCPNWNDSSTNGSSTFSSTSPGSISAFDTAGKLENLPPRLPQPINLSSFVVMAARPF